MRHAEQVGGTPAAAPLQSVWMLLGSVAITALFCGLLVIPAMQDTAAGRLFGGHPVKPVLVALFVWGLAELAWRGCQSVREYRVLAVSDWSGISVRPGDLGDSLRWFGPNGPLDGSAAATRLGQRLSSALFYVQRHSSGVEPVLDQLSAADRRRSRTEQRRIETIGRSLLACGLLAALAIISGALRLGFDPEKAETLRLASSASDTMALALFLWVPLVLTRVLIFSLDHWILDRVDGTVSSVFAPCFGRNTPESQAFLGVVDGVSRVILQATRDAWREQGQLWSRTVEQLGESQMAALHHTAQQLMQPLARVVANQDEQFNKFLGSLETLRQLSQKSLADVAAKMTAHQAVAKRQVELLGVLVSDEGRMTNLQRSLNENLVTLANVQALDQAIHSLTAAAHLLTARIGRGSSETRPARDELKLGVAA